MNTWPTFLQNVKDTLSSLALKGCDTPFFRGQPNSSWGLLPSIARYKWQGNRENSERDLYFDFVTQAGVLLPENNSAWSNIFAMQHYGLPTRLLDWTETFSVALYFAIKNADKEAAVWILNPWELNERALKLRYLIDPLDLPYNYYEYYVECTAKLEGSVIAMSPLRHNPRLFHQRAGFTLHDDLETPLEYLHPSSITKLVLEQSGFTDAKHFLELAGINEFTLFPDLDGLARELKRRYIQ